MGQYWIPVNLDKREFIMPHKLGSGLKLWEQLANHPGTGAGLIILCAAMPEARGGGDLDLQENWHGPERKFPEHNTKPGPMPEAYEAIAKRTIGRWAGDRITLVGDYAERADLAGQHNADLIYSLCGSEEDRLSQIKWLKEQAKRVGAETLEYREKALRLQHEKVYTDISDDVAAVIEHELLGKYSGDGWRTWKENDEVKA